MPTFSTDPLNCGACGHNCLGGTCGISSIGTACQPLLLSPSNFSATQLAISTDSVYVSNYNGTSLTSTVLRYSKATGAGTVLPIPASNSLWSIATDSQFLYWTNQPPGDPTHGFVTKANLDGSGINNMFAINQTGPAAILADSSGVYWITGLNLNGAFDSAIARARPYGHVAFHAGRDAILGSAPSQPTQPTSTGSRPRCNPTEATARSLSGQRLKVPG